jgi:hypothetical protein
MYGGLVHHSRSVWSSDRISAPSQHGVHYGGFPPSAPVPQKYSRGTGRRNLKAAELFSYTLNFEVWWLSAVGGISRLGRCRESSRTLGLSVLGFLPPISIVSSSTRARLRHLLSPIAAEMRNLPRLQTTRRPHRMRLIAQPTGEEGQVG